MASSVRNTRYGFNGVFGASIMHATSPPCACPLDPVQNLGAPCQLQGAQPWIASLSLRRWATGAADGWQASLRCTLSARSRECEARADRVIAKSVWCEQIQVAHYGIAAPFPGVSPEPSAKWRAVVPTVHSRDVGYPPLAARHQASSVRSISLSLHCFARARHQQTSPPACTCTMLRFRCCDAVV